MAKKKATATKQKQLEDSQGKLLPSDETLDKSIEEHQAKMQARKEAGDVEVEAKNRVGTLLHEKKLTFYKYGGTDPNLSRVTAELDPGETTVKIKKQPKSKDEEE